VRQRAIPAALLPLALLIGLAACAPEEDVKLPVDCREGAASVERALATLPEPARLSGGTLLSECVRLAEDAGELQNVGISYTAVAERLAPQVDRSDRAAFALGYLIAATRRGADRTNGVGLELAFRIEQTAGIEGPPPAHRRAFERGQALGRAEG
jgi:hypothetical protein